MIKEKDLDELGFKKNYYSDESDNGYWTYNFTDDLWTDLSLISSYSKNNKCKVSLFPYEIFEYDNIKDVKALIEAIEKGLH